MIITNKKHRIAIFALEYYCSCSNWRGKTYKWM